MTGQVKKQSTKHNGRLRGRTSLEQRTKHSVRLRGRTSLRCRPMCSLWNPDRSSTYTVRTSGYTVTGEHRRCGGRRGRRGRRGRCGRGVLTACTPAVLRAARTHGELSDPAWNKGGTPIGNGCKDQLNGYMRGGGGEYAKPVSKRFGADGHRQRSPAFIDHVEAAVLHGRPARAGYLPPQRRSAVL